jgi:hypothetical protein
MDKVTVISCNRLTSFRYSTSSFMITGPSLRRENSPIGKPFSEKNIMRTSADLSRKAVFFMWELKSMSAQLAKRVFEYKWRFLTEGLGPADDEREGIEEGCQEDATKRNAEPIAFGEEDIAEQ